MISESGLKDDNQKCLQCSAEINYSTIYRLFKNGRSLIAPPLYIVDNFTISVF